jgi:hypothetical protein
VCVITRWKKYSVPKWCFTHTIQFLGMSWWNVISWQKLQWHSCSSVLTLQCEQQQQHPVEVEVLPTSMFRLGYHYISLIDQSVLDHVITISTKCITSNKTCHSNTMSVELHIVSHMYALNRQLCRKLISSCWAGIDTCPTLSQAVSTVESKRDPLHRSKSKTVTWYRGPLCGHVLWLVYFPTSDIVMSYVSLLMSCN